MAAPRPKSRKNSAEYEKRLRLILRLFIRGYSQDEIGQAAGVTQQTISSDLAEIKKRNQAASNGKIENWQDPKTLAAEINMKFDEQEREAWDVVSNSQGTSKVAGLKEVREINEKRIKILQELGLIYKEPEKIATGNYDELQEQIRRRNKERSDLQRFI